MSAGDYRCLRSRGPMRSAGTSESSAFTLPQLLIRLFRRFLLAVHHDDLAHATGTSYRPRDDVVAALVTMYGAIHGMPTGPDPWACLLQATGR